MAARRLGAAPRLDFEAMDGAAAAQCLQLPPELWEHIQSFMPLDRRLQARRVSSDFRALVDRGTARGFTQGLSRIRKAKHWSV